MALPRTRIAAFRALYRRHYGFVWQTMRRFGVLPALTEDAVQDAFVVAYRRLDDLVPEASTQWLYGIVRRVASNYRRAHRRAARKQRAVAESLASPTWATPVPEAIVDLDTFLHELTPIDRELFVLTQLEGLTGPETAELLALNPSTTYDHIGRLRRRFCEHLGDRVPRDVLLAVRRNRPRASTRGWVALVPRLWVGIVGRATLASGLASWPALGLVVIPIAAVAVLGATGVPDERERAPSSVTADEREATATPEVSPVAPSPRPLMQPSVAGAASTATVPEAAVAGADGGAAMRDRTSSSTATAPVRAVAEEDNGTKREQASLARHNELLREAADELRAGDIDAALADIEQHRTEFPDSPLADARTALRIEALCAADRRAQARDEASRLLAARPTTPVRGRIERSCVGPSVDPNETGQEG